jgi:putative transposase
LCFRRREVDARAVVRTAVAQREVVDEAKRKTTAARRDGGAQNSKAYDMWGSLRGVDLSKPLPFVEDME